MKKYNQVEGILYSHYRKKSKLGLFKGALLRTEKRIQQLEKELKECKLDIKDDLQGVTYTEDKITTSSNNQSTMEKALIKAEDRMERELRVEKAYKYKIKDKIRKVQKQIDSIEVVLDDLTEEEIQIIEKKYGDKLIDREIGEDLRYSRSTIARKKKELIEMLMELL